MKRGTWTFIQIPPGSYPPPGTSPHLCFRDYPIGTRGLFAKQVAPTPFTSFQITADVSVQNAWLPVTPRFAGELAHWYEITGVVTGPIAGGMAMAAPQPSGTKK